MAFILTGYSEHGCQEFILPEIDNANHFISLDHILFCIPENIELHFDVVAGCWRFQSHSNNCIVSTTGICPGQEIKTGSSIHISVGSTLITITIMEFMPDICGFQKYSLNLPCQLSIGCDSDNQIICTDNPFISRHHAVLSVDTNNCIISDQSTNGIFINGKRVRGTKSIEYGTCIDFFGVQILWLGKVIAIGCKWGYVHCGLTKLSPPSSSTALSVTKTNNPIKQYFRRSPRNLPTLFNEKIEIEAPPQPQKIVNRPLFLTVGPAITMALPMIIGTMIAILGAQSQGTAASMYMYTGIIIAILSSLIGSIWAFINMRYTKKQEIEAEIFRIKKYEAYITQKEDEISDKYIYNTQSLNYIYPDARSCTQYTESSPELWNRNTSHEDFLYFRLGVGSIPFQCPIIIPQQKFSLIEDNLNVKPLELKEKFKLLKNVPTGIDFRKKRLVGVVSRNKEQTTMILKNLVVQAAANICYTDIKLVFLFEGNTPSERSSWDFARWLPHTWSSDHKIRYFASNKIERSEICFALANVLRSRAETITATGKKQFRPHYIVFVSDPDLLDGEPVSKYLLSSEELLGVTTVFFAERYEQLPNNCIDIIKNDTDFCGVLNTELGDSVHQQITFDVVDTKLVDSFVRTISSIEVRETEIGGEIPDSLTFLEMYHANTLKDLNVCERWIKNRTYENMKVPVGQKAGGAEWYLDIHEKYHGPHGLVAGTTGSGKSEILQTYILSLAVNFSPSDVAFFLIDFKGGGMANLFANLPHTVGHISNLSGNQIHRAMVSIKSENRRRQKIFGEFGINHIDQYTKLLKSGETSMAIPHLFIVIDEFAELKREEPDFMRELISVAQVGRSLGIHLILATQKPGGTVDDNIRSNTRFKLCLRVQDRQDSNEILHKPDAAYLTQAGRCYMQVGNDEIYEIFQSGWSGAIYNESPTVGLELASIWSNTGKAEITGTGRKQHYFEQHRIMQLPGLKEKTQLNAIVEHISQIAQSTLSNEQFYLWLPVLSQEVYLFDIFKEPMFDGEQWPDRLLNTTLSVPVGIYDDPANQTQEPLVIDLASNGNLAICGSIASGKSTFLQTFLYGVVNKYSPNQVNFYVLDYSNHLLAPFENVCHCGGVIFDHEPDKTEKLFVLLSNIIAERKKQFQGGSYPQFIKASGVMVPYIIVAIDNYTGFREKTENKYENDLLTLSREGSSYGIYLVVTAGGFGVTELQNRIADNFRSVVCLEMGEKFKYSEVLRTHHFDILPEVNIKGRGLANVNGRILEYQTALAVPSVNDYTRAEKLNICFSEMNHIWKGKLARKIPVIPVNPTWDNFLNYENTAKSCLCEPGYLSFGWNAKDASVVSIDLSKTYCWLISGKPRTGKTNLLKVLASSAALSASERYILDFGNHCLQKFANENHAKYVSDSKTLFEMLRDLIPTFKKRNQRKQELLAKGYDEEDIYKEISKFTPIYIFVDNLTEFLKVAYNPSEGIGTVSGFLENITEKGYLHNIFIIAALDQSNTAQSVGYKSFSYITSYKTGIHLGGNTAAQRLFDFSGLSYQEQSKTTKPGTGLLAADDSETAVQKVILPQIKK